MELSAALAADLRFLTEALEESGTDLSVALQRLMRDTRLAVPTFLGLTLTVVINSAPVTFTALEETADPGTAATSALLPLTSLCDAEPGSVIAFYATQPGAFVDLAADLSFALGIDPGGIILDAGLDPPAAGSGLPGLRDQSEINQAIGILIELGYPPEDAGAELRRRAGAGQLTLRGAAKQLIEATIEGVDRGSSEIF